MTELRKITQQELNEMLELHTMHLKSFKGQGKRANFRDLDLSGLVLSYQCWRGADFRGANLKGAWFSGASLELANISHLTRQEFLDLVRMDMYNPCQDLHSTSFKAEPMTEINKQLCKSNIYNETSQQYIFETDLDVRYWDGIEIIEMSMEGWAKNDSNNKSIRIRCHTSQRREDGTYAIRLTVDAPDNFKLMDVSRNIT